MKNHFKGKNILVTGGTGSIGSEIVRQVLTCEPNTVRIYSRDEYKQFRMMEDFKENKEMRYLLGDVRDKDRLGVALKGVDIVFHAAALKQVPSCEYNPFESVKTNVLGTQNLIEMAIERNVKQVIGISTDKSVGTVSTMGATKLLAEKLITNANYYKGPAPTIFSCVRFGNVMGSRGSVIPVFKDQIAQGGPVTVTNEKMYRFMMSISQAANLVLKAADLARGGDIFILKMPVLRLMDLAKAMIELVAPRYGYKPSQIAIKVTGTRMGEKLMERLISDEEGRYVQETSDMFIIPTYIDIPHLEIKPYKYPQAQPSKIKLYSSEKLRPISKKEIIELLQREKLI
jgi:UDP-N-acetylglucosamine 4,6-dehydratase/5-epimerase